MCCFVVNFLIDHALIFNFQSIKMQQTHLLTHFSRSGPALECLKHMFLVRATKSASKNICEHFMMK